MLFHSGLLHRSLPAMGQGVKRYSLVARLCNSDCKVPDELANRKEIVAYPIVVPAGNTLVGQVAIVTGGSRGIGRAIAEHLLQQGSKVAILGRDAQSLEDAKRSLSLVAGADNVYDISVDVNDYDKLKHAFEMVQQRFGPITTVFANAATNNAKGRVDELSVEQWFAPLSDNLKCTLNTCKIAVDFMKSHGGNIITLGSGIGHAGAPFVSSYACAKAANWILTKSLAQEVSEFRINVNELIPGPVKTDMNPNAQGEHWKEPDDIGPLAVLLASQDLKNGATGQLFSLKRF